MTNPRFRPSLRQYRILEAANKELKEQVSVERNNKHTAQRVAWYFYIGFAVLVMIPLINKYFYGV